MAFSLPKPSELLYPKSFHGSQLPTLNKVEAFDQFIYCGYSNGILLQYKYAASEKSFQLQAKLNPYQNTDVIDMDQFDTDVLLTCTHT